MSVILSIIKVLNVIHPLLECVFYVIGILAFIKYLKK